ncbi:MAG: DUF255 domain-containing protein, partial [Prevotellaceae bacterium]|nr:DUF255 domain-containing protein [Prevotellaceae bacterium]
MKKLGILILLATFGTATMAQMKWYSFEEAVALSEKKPRKIFIDVYTDWCGWCKVMDRNTFSNPSIAEYMNKNYYSVKLNAEMTDTVRFKGHIFVNPSSSRRSSHQLAVSLLNGKMSFPSVVFMNEQFQILQVI